LTVSERFTKLILRQNDHLLEMRIECFTTKQLIF